MPFDNTGTFTPPNGAENAAPGQVIRSATWNSIFTDISSALTTLGQAQAVNNAVVVAVSTTAGTVETLFQSVALPAGYLATNGNGVRLTAWGSTANNTNGKNVRLYFGGTVVATTNSISLQNGIWNIGATILRTSSITQASIGTLFTQGTSGATGYTVGLTSPSETLTNSVTVKVTGQNVTANASDIVGIAFMVEPVNTV